MVAEQKQTWTDLHTALQIAERELRVTKLRLDKADERTTIAEARVEDLLANRSVLPPDRGELNELRNHVSRLQRDLEGKEGDLRAEIQERQRVLEERNQTLRSLDRLTSERLDAVYQRPQAPAPVVVACSCPRSDDGRSPTEIGRAILDAAGVPPQDLTDLLEPYLSGRISAVELAISYLEKRPAVALDKTDATELVRDLEKRVEAAALAKKGAKPQAEKLVKYARDKLIARLTRKGATETEEEDELEETADGITYLHGKKPPPAAWVKGVPVGEAPEDLGGPVIPSGPPPIPEGMQR